MTEQMTLSGGSAPLTPLTRVYLFVRWLVVSVLAAWLSPFFLLALLAALLSAVGGALSLSAADVRENLVDFATLDSTAWKSAGSAWQIYAWVCGAGVLLWRVFTAKPVRRALDAGMCRFEAATARAFAPVGQWLDGLPRVAACALVIAPVAALLFFGIFLGSQPRSEANNRKPVGAPLPLPKAPPSVALKLPSGAIRAGQATIEQRGDDTYVVVFK